MIKIVKKIAYVDNRIGSSKIIFSDGYQLLGLTQTIEQLYDTMVKNNLFSLSDIKRYDNNLYARTMCKCRESFVG